MLILLLALACGEPAPVAPDRVVPTPEALETACAEAIGPPRVEEPAPGVFVAVGYDLANTIVVQTDEGRVVVDPGMSPGRARPVREALDAVTSGPIRALVYTHSHIDHVGGASVWLEDGTEVWATDALVPHLYKQYAAFLPAERARGARQFGRDVALESVPCSALGRPIDLDAALELGFVPPTRTFSDAASFEVGGVRFDLREAHGETHDQLFVWLADRRTLLPGDNWYRAFPNLYTIRGTTPRPVDDWIASLDTMRRLAPAVLVPSHTAPLVGEAEVEQALRDYRDGIQWVRDAVVRGANDGIDVDTLAASIVLPPHLASKQPLTELYGQVDWSARAIYDGSLGWFDGEAVDLYPLAPAERARRTVDAMGGPEAVLEAARAAREADPRWSAQLLDWLEDDARTEAAVVDEELALTYEALAADVYNSNGRSYLLQSAHERRHGLRAGGRPNPGDGFVDGIPLDLLFGVLQTRLIPQRAMAVHESVVFRFPAEEATWVVTVRRGVAEVVEGEPLPGTPEPVATVTADGHTWRRIALGLDGPAGALASGDLEVDGLIAFRRFMTRFDRDPDMLPARKP